MPLSAYLPRLETLTFRNGGSVTFHGLTTNDISMLISTHRQDIDALLALVSVTVSKIGRGTVLSLLHQAPMLVANVIALASDYTTLQEAVDAAYVLPMPLQTRALEMIFELTFDEVGGIQPFMQSLAAALGRILPSGAATKLFQSRME